MNSGLKTECVPSYRLLTEDQIQEIHRASLEILETIGVQMACLVPAWTRSTRRSARGARPTGAPARNTTEPSCAGRCISNARYLSARYRRESSSAELRGHGSPTLERRLVVLHDAGSRTTTIERSGRGQAGLRRSGSTGRSRDAAGPIRSWRRAERILQRF